MDGFGLFVVLALGVAALVGALYWWSRQRAAMAARQLADAREEARQLYDRLGGQLLNLGPGEDPAVQQALADAGERYNAAGSQLERATTTRQYQLAGQTAVEGLYYARAARTALGLDPGPELPAIPGQRGAGQLTEDREVMVEGRTLRASPRPGDDTPYYYPGGNVAGRPVPGGWYSEPWWKTALVAGAWGIGGALVFNALFSGGFGHGGYDAGYQDGVEHAESQDSGGDGGGDSGGSAEGGDAGGGDPGGGDAGGGGYDTSFDAGAGNGSWDGGGWDGGGDFGGGFE